MGLFSNLETIKILNMSDKIMIADVAVILGMVITGIVQKPDPSNFLLMNAVGADVTGADVAGVIGTAVSASVLLSLFG